MKILLLSPNQIGRYNWGHQLFRNEIGRQHDVLYYGEGYPNYDENLEVPQIVNKYKPDILLTYCWKYARYRGIGRVKNIPKVHISMDYVGKYLKSQNKFFADHKYDLVFGSATRTVSALKDNKVCERIRILPFSVDTNIYKKIDLPKINDVLVAFGTRLKYYAYRRKIQIILEEMGVKIITQWVIHEELVKAINESKIIPTSNNRWGGLSMRYTETLACGGFLLADKPRDLERLGYGDGKHLVIYDGLDDFKDKVIYYLKPENEKEREEIARQGMEFVRKNHNNEVRVEEMTKIIIEELYKS